MKKLLLSIIASLFLLGCDNQWMPDRRPETTEERENVAREEAIILNQIPHTLSGHDQDWDDVIKQAHNIAVNTWCKERLYEYNTGGHYTGRMKEINN